jgi:hypothetical protein
MTPKRTRSSGGGVGSGAGSSGSVRHSRSTCGRDGSGEGAVGSRSAAQAFEESVHFLASCKGQKVVGGQSSKRVEQEARCGQGGSPEIGSWAGGSGQSDGEASGGSSQADGEAGAAADTSGRCGAGQSVHTSVVCLLSDWGVHPASQPGVPSDERVL